MFLISHVLGWFEKAEPKPVFTVHIWMKSGKVLNLDCKSFEAKRDSGNVLTSLSWELAQPGQLLYIRLDEVAAVYSREK